MVTTAERIAILLLRPVIDLIGRFFRRRPSLPEAGPISAHAAGESPWFPDSFPPRAHNRVTPLLHGDEYFSDLVRVLRAAERRVTIAGWALTPLISLLRDGQEPRDASILAHLLNEVSQRAEVYVLIWSGAPAFFEPTVRMAEEAQQSLLAIAPNVRYALDHRASFGHCHHQKAVTIDGRIAYVGGIDLTTYQGDRWDTILHEIRLGPNCHDVQMRIDGEAVQDVEQNFTQRWQAVTGERLEPLPAPDLDSSHDTPVQIVRTIPAGFYPFAEGGEHGIAHAYLAAIARAKRFIYLENQYIWTPEIVDALAEAMNRLHDGQFRVLIVLPAKAYTGKYDNDAHVRKLQTIDAGRGIFQAYSPYAAGPASSVTGYRYLPIYVHAKVGIVDDEWFTVGSANLNRRGMATDTEMNVQGMSPDVARTLRTRLWSDHLQIPAEQIAARDPIDCIDQDWQQTADRVEAALRARSVPPMGHALRYIPGTSPGSRVLDGIQIATLER